VSGPAGAEGLTREERGRSYARASARGSAERLLARRERSRSEVSSLASQGSSTCADGRGWPLQSSWRPAAAPPAPHTVPTSTPLGYV
jgi:hypothetical protein